MLPTWVAAPVLPGKRPLEFINVRAAREASGYRSSGSVFYMQTCRPGALRVPHDPVTMCTYLTL